jgi:hypothetical protein
VKVVLCRTAERRGTGKKELNAKSARSAKVLYRGGG